MIFVADSLEFRKVVNIGDNEYVFRIQTLRDTVEINRKAAELTKKYLKNEEIGVLNYASQEFMVVAQLSVLEDSVTKTDWETIPTPITDAVQAEVQQWFASFREPKRGTQAEGGTAEV